MDPALNGHRADRGQALLETALVLPILGFLAVAVVQLSETGTARLRGKIAARAVAWAPGPAEEAPLGPLSGVRDRGADEDRARVVSVDRQPGGRSPRGGNVRAGNPARSREALARGGSSGAGRLVEGPLNALYVTRRSTLEIEAPGLPGLPPVRWKEIHVVDSRGEEVRDESWFRRTMRMRDPPAIATEGP